MNWIRVAYLYLFALVGLALISIGAVRLVGLGLRSYVFTEADAEARIYYAPEPPLRVGDPSRIDRLAADTTLDDATRSALRDWAAEYERQRQQREAVDPVRAGRERDAAGAIALLLVGFPLYLYHWRTIRRERWGSGNREAVGRAPSTGKAD